MVIWDDGLKYAGNGGFRAKLVSPTNYLYWDFI